MRKGFLSFSLLMHQLFSGTVTETALDDGIFYFGCTRSVALDLKPEAALSLVIHTTEPDYQQYCTILLTILRPALVKAEREGRVVWRAKYTASSVRQFEMLLAQNALQPVRMRTSREQRAYDMVSRAFGGNPNIAEAFGNYPLEFLV